MIKKILALFSLTILLLSTVACSRTKDNSASPVVTISPTIREVASQTPTPIASPTTPPAYCSESVGRYLAYAAYNIRGAIAQALILKTAPGGESLVATDLRVAHQTMDVWAKQQKDCLVDVVATFVNELAAIDQSPYTIRKNAKLMEIGRLGALAATALGSDETFKPIPGPTSNSDDSNPGQPADVHITTRPFDSDTVKAFLALYD